MFGVARQFGGQEGYSPAKRTLSWLTRGLLVYAFAFGSISILGVTVLCNIVLVLKMSALLHSQIVQSPLIWLAPGVSSDHKRRDKSQRWISSEDTNISNERIYYISQA